jgi:hypothetical protein
MANEYITKAELKPPLEIPAADTQYDAQLDIAREAASRACDGYKHTLFYPATQTRYYSPDPYQDELRIHDLNTLTSLQLDFDGDDTFEETWTEGTDFDLLPLNHSVDGIPANRIRLRPSVGRNWPSYPKSVKLVGSFGWAATPVNVKLATALLANRLFKRLRETPYAIMSVVAGDMVAAARIGKVDPDAANLLDNLPGAQTPPLQSLKLG